MKTFRQSHRRLSGHSNTLESTLANDLSQALAHQHCTCFVRTATTGVHTLNVISVRHFMYDGRTSRSRARVHGKLVKTRRNSSTRRVRSLTKYRTSAAP